jgi:hypothetical protein
METKMPISRATRCGRSSLTMLVEASLFGYREQIETELVIRQSNLTRLEAGTDEHRPEITFAVIHFMIVDLDFSLSSFGSISSIGP